jgi:hypothetical protein
LETDLKRLKAFSSELESMETEMFDMRQRSRVWDLDYFPPEEHDKIENLLFRYLVLLLGSDYDFKFDFNDGSYQCCTEVIYRALNSRGGFHFNLIKRMGALTLSADDILDYHFSMDPAPFDVVFYAEKRPGSRGNKARIYIGEEALKRLKDLR